MSMYTLLKYSDNYLKTSGNLCQFCRDVPNNVKLESESFKFKSKFSENTNNTSVTNEKIAVPLKYLCNFWRTLKMPLINCEVTLILNWSERHSISESNRATTFAITDTRFYVPVVNLSIQDNTKLLQQLKSGFKRTINWNKYQPKVSIERTNEYLELIEIFKEEIDFLFYHLKIMPQNKPCRAFSSEGRNKRLQYYNRWTK